MFLISFISEPGSDLRIVNIQTCSDEAEDAADFSPEDENDNAETEISEKDRAKKTQFAC